jgi:uncharacterized protein YciI
MPGYAVHYTYDDREELRMQNRPEHRAFLFDLAEQGIVLAAGAYTDSGQPGGIIVVRADSAAEAEQALDPDPYRQAGVVIDRVAREWGQALGPWSE